MYNTGGTPRALDFFRVCFFPLQLAGWVAHR